MYAAAAAAAARPWLQSPFAIAFGTAPARHRVALRQGKVVPARLSLVPYQHCAAEKQQVEVCKWSVHTPLFRQLYSRLT